MRLLLASSLLAIGSPVRADDLKEPITPLVKKFLDGKKHAGLVIGVRQNGTSTAFGFGTVTTAGGEATPDAATMFEIGSITKAFTGLLLADAVVPGKKLAVVVLSAIASPDVDKLGFDLVDKLASKE